VRVDVVEEGPVDAGSLELMAMAAIRAAAAAPAVGASTSTPTGRDASPDWGEAHVDAPGLRSRAV